MTEFVTKRVYRGAALQVGMVGQSKYIKIVRESDGRTAAAFQSAPFKGRLRDLYLAFEAAMTQPMPEGETFTPEQIEFGLSLGDLLIRDPKSSYGAYVLRS